MGIMPFLSSCSLSSYEDHVLGLHIISMDHGGMVGLQVHSELKINYGCFDFKINEHMSVSVSRFAFLKQGQHFLFSVTVGIKNYSYARAASCILSFPRCINVYDLFGTA
jgi:hypothetical protein